MERARDYTASLIRDANLQYTARYLSEVFSGPRTKPARLISGLALSGSRIDNEYHVSPGGVFFTLPLPILAEHDWARPPIGRITQLEARGAQLRFWGEIVNRPYTDPLWNQIVAKEIYRVSINVEGSFDQSRTWVPYSITSELSIVASGRDPGAMITRCATRDHVVNLYAPSEVVHWERP